MGRLQSQSELVLALQRWQASGQEMSSALKSELEAEARRELALRLQDCATWTDLDADELAKTLAEWFSQPLKSAASAILRKYFRDLFAELLSSEEPREVTRWLWRWEPGGSSAGEVEAGLFAAVDFELRRKLHAIARSRRFADLGVDTGDLVSDLYLKLRKYDIPRLPENRKQFLALADVVVQNILKDIEKQAWKRREVVNEDVLAFHADERTAQNQLQWLLNAERPANKVTPEMLETLLSELPERQREIVRLRSQGLTVRDIVELKGWSKATIVRDHQKTVAYLQKALSLA